MVLPHFADTTEISFIACVRLRYPVAQSGIHWLIKMPASRTAELALRIAENIERIDAYISSKNTPPVSFDASASGLSLYDHEIDAARQLVLDPTDELHALMLGPVGILTSPPVGALRCNLQIGPSGQA